MFRLPLVGISASKSIRVGFKTAEFIVYCLLRMKSRAACADWVTNASSTLASGLITPALVKLAPVREVFASPSFTSVVSTDSGMLPLVPSLPFSISEYVVQTHSDSPACAEY